MSTFFFFKGGPLLFYFYPPAIAHSSICISLIQAFFENKDREDVSEDNKSRYDENKVAKLHNI